MVKHPDFQLVHRLRVRWAEVDMQKIVFNAHYLMYFDTAITDYWRALGLPYEEAMLELGGELYVKKATVQYHGSARFDDLLDVVLKCLRIGNSSMVFSGAIFRGEVLLVSCELVYVFADPISQSSRAVPLALRSLINRFEAGECVVTTRVGDWAVLGAQVGKIRAAVSVQEQGSASMGEPDETDGLALHAVVLNALEQTIATGRLVSLVCGAGEISRLAVHRAVRVAGIGQGVLETLIHEARKRGCTEALVHAQASTVGFYLRQGFLVGGAPSMAVGIPYVELTRKL